MNRKFWLLGAAASCLALGAVFTACGDDDNESNNDERQEVVDTAVRIASANGANTEDAEYYLAHSTDQFLEFFFPEGRDACAAAPAECISPLTNPTVDEETIEIDGEEATVTMNSDEGSFLIGMVKEDDAWKADTLGATSDEVAEGTEMIDLEMNEFAFEFDEGSEDLTNGTFAFSIKNTGDQVHEAVMARVPAEGSLEEILMSEDESSFEFIGVKAPVASGAELDWAVPELEPGRYAIVCFLPDTEDPEGTPHAFKGMVAEFVVE